MPCFDSRNNERQVLCTYEHEVRIRAECRHNSDVAELLCYLLTNSAGARTHAQCNKALGQWWSEHQERDKRKAARNGKAK